MPITLKKERTQKLEGRKRVTLAHRNVSMKMRHLLSLITVYQPLSDLVCLSKPPRATPVAVAPAL